MRASAPAASFWLGWVVSAIALTLMTAAAAEACLKGSRNLRAKLEIPKAQVGREMPIEDVFIVRVGFWIAFQRVHEIPGCAALFAGLDLDGPTALSSTVYSRPRHPAEKALCDAGALAVTRARRTEISLCLNLRNLTREGVAALLIHEALHTAGLGEWPVDPVGPTSGEITRSVLRACSLGSKGGP